MPYRRALVLAVLLALAPGLPNGALAGEPTDQLRSEIDQLYRALQQPAPSRNGEREARDVLDRMFDWTRMAEASLRGHWQQRTAAERAEFTGLFADLFRRVYVSRIHVVDASKFQYLGDVIDRERATVNTKILTKQGSAIDVDYAVRLGDGQRWRVQDVRVEQVSLIDNYRTQFNTFIGRTSYEALVQKLRGMAK